MYNKLFKQLETIGDVSLIEILNKITHFNFDNEVLAHMDGKDYNEVFTILSSIQRSNNSLLPPVSLILVLNKLNQITSLRTSRYL